MTKEASSLSEEEEEVEDEMKEQGKCPSDHSDRVDSAAKTSHDTDTPLSAER